MPRFDQRSSYYNSSHTHAHRVVGCCCWGAGLLLGGRIVAWCPVQEEGNLRVPSSRKPGLNPIITCVHGDRGCGNPIPGDVVETWGFALSVPKAKKVLKGLPRATHCTGRAQTSGNVTAWVELCPPHLTIRVKVRARRGLPEEEKKLTIIRIRMYCAYLCIRY